MNGRKPADMDMTTSKTDQNNSQPAQFIIVEKNQDTGKMPALSMDQGSEKETSLVDNRPVTQTYSYNDTTGQTKPYTANGSIQGNGVQYRTLPGGSEHYPPPDVSSNHHKETPDGAVGGNDVPPPNAISLPTPSDYNIHSMGSSTPTGQSSVAYAQATLAGTGVTQQVRNSGSYTVDTNGVPIINGIPQPCHDQYATHHQTPQQMSIDDQSALLPPAMIHNPTPSRMPQPFPIHIPSPTASPTHVRDTQHIADPDRHHIYSHNQYTSHHMPISASLQGDAPPVSQVAGHVSSSPDHHAPPPNIFQPVQYNIGVSQPGGQQYTEEHGEDMTSTTYVWTPSGIAAAQGMATPAITSKPPPGPHQRSYIGSAANTRLVTGLYTPHPAPRSAFTTVPPRDARVPYPRPSHLPTGGEMGMWPRSETTSPTEARPPLQHQHNPPHGRRFSQPAVAFVNPNLFDSKMSIYDNVQYVWSDQNPHNYTPYTQGNRTYFDV